MPLRELVQHVIAASIAQRYSAFAGCVHTLSRTSCEAQRATVNGYTTTDELALGNRAKLSLCTPQQMDA